MTQYDEFWTLFNSFKRNTINQLIWVKVKSIRWKNKHYRQNKFLKWEFFEMKSKTQCDLKKVKNKVPLEFTSYMEVLTQISV